MRYLVGRVSVAPLSDDPRIHRSVYVCACVCGITGAVVGIGGGLVVAMRSVVASSRRHRSLLALRFHRSGACSRQAFRPPLARRHHGSGARPFVWLCIQQPSGFREDKQVRVGGDGTLSSVKAERCGTAPPCPRPQGTARSSDVPKSRRRADVGHLTPRAPISAWSAPQRRLAVVAALVVVHRACICDSAQPRTSLAQHSAAGRHIGQGVRGRSQNVLPVYREPRRPAQIGCACKKGLKPESPNQDSARRHRGGWKGECLEGDNRRHAMGDLSVGMLVDGRTLSLFCGRRVGVGIR